MGIFNFFQKDDDSDDIADRLLTTCAEASSILLEYIDQYREDSDDFCHYLIKANSSASALVLSAYLARHFSPSENRKSIIKKGAKISGVVLPKVAEYTLTYIYQNELDDQSLKGLKGFNLMMNMQEEKTGRYHSIFYNMAHGDPNRFGVDLCLALSRDLISQELITEKFHEDILKIITAIK